MSLLLSPELTELRARVRAFMDEHVLAAEDAIVAEDARGERTTLDALRERARAAGLWTPHLPEAWGGLGLGVMGMCALFREMGRTPVGPSVFNCDAPDQGNMDLLLLAGDEAQRERYLRPLVQAEVTSAFCMTEPAPGAGADPSNLRTSATPAGEGWRLSGHKWYATGAVDASFLIVVARTSEDRRAGATLFLVEREQEGVELVREIPTLAEPLLAHREAELRFHDVRLGPEAVLGGVGQGFALAQQRLIPARLTHCMRWLGLAERALELCRDYVSRRVSFGKTLAKHERVQDLIHRGAARIHAGNLMTLHCAWLLEQGDPGAAKPYASLAKEQVANTLCGVLDDAIQMHGGLGYSDDLPFARWYRYARAARIADGPDEVHRWVVARAFLAGDLDLLV